MTKKETGQEVFGKKTKRSGKKSKFWRNVLRGFMVFVIICLIAGFFIGYRYYKLIYVENVELDGKKELYVYIPSKAGFDDVKKILYPQHIIKDTNSFEWLCEHKKYSLNVKSGRYLLKDGMSNNEFINLLRSGKQDPVKLTFNNIRTKEQFISRVTRFIEADSLSLINLLNDTAFLSKYGLDPDNVMCIFIPNTYELFWDTPAEKFFVKMHAEYKKFWNKERLDKAAAVGLSPNDAVILASIVYQETKKKDEMPKVAGVYLNRIRIGMPLQADPTVIFALGDFSIKRVLTVQTQYNSPYNTYRYAGLPPGPICLPDSYVVDKVLDYEKHDYLYFCAKEDLSGYHNFAITPAQHAQNAQKYHNALNRRKIKK
ncbi:MAG TPA: endolytic transglycosylase MltG [Bacteroidales bacterium]|nr:endolytic transglycosylase MltG [Bacteroidales bacterium]